MTATREQFELVSLSFYGITVNIQTLSHELALRVKNDFSCFLVSPIDTPQVTFVHDLNLAAPKTRPTGTWRGLKLYRDKHTLFVDHEGAYLLANFDTEHFAFSGDNLHRMHEVVYLSVLSRVGKLLDLKGLHKVHAFGVQFGDRPVIGVGPSGVGKSTLLFQSLAEKFHMISDDIPLLSSDGILPFPLRLSVTADSPIDNYDFLLERRLYGTKKLINAKTFFNGSWEPLKDPIFLILRRSGASKPQIQKCTRLRLFGSLFKHMVLGIGTPMVLELFWQPGTRDFYIKTHIFFRRLITAILTCKEVEKFGIFDLSSDKELNLKYLEEWIGKPTPSSTTNDSNTTEPSAPF